VGDDKVLTLPGNGYEMVAKILHAYALCGDEPTALDTVAVKAGMHKTQVSGNNGFLVSIGLLTDEKAKALTPAGKNWRWRLVTGWTRTRHSNGGAYFSTRRQQEESSICCAYRKRSRRCAAGQNRFKPRTP
jgi:hypothetical protein